KGIINIVQSHYLDGLASYGVSAGGFYEYGATVPAGYPLPNPFSDSDCAGIISRAISEKWVQTPQEYNGQQPTGGLFPDVAAVLAGPKFRVVYTLFLGPGNAYTDPNIFGKNTKQLMPEAASCWVTSNSDLAGSLSTFAHELIEAGSGEEIADPCQTQPSFYLDGVRLPKYQVNGACWPDEATIVRWMIAEVGHTSRYRGSLAAHGAIKPVTH
ncbi:MAG: hypothetical protein V4587_16785, partial [Acidobacteriota bacterium]